jgi:predicted nucleotide-binding protein
MRVNPFEVIFDEVIGRDDVRMRIDELASKEGAPPDAVVESLRDLVLGPEGILLNGRERPESDCADVLVSVRRLLTEHIVAHSGDYRDLLAREERARGEAHRRKEELEATRGRLELAVVDERHPEKGEKWSGLRRAGAVLRRRPPSRRMKSEHRELLGRVLESQEKADALTKLRERTERRLRSQTAGDPEFLRQLEVLLSDMGPTLRDEVILPSVLDSLEREPLCGACEVTERDRETSELGDEEGTHETEHEVRREGSKDAVDQLLEHVPLQQRNASTDTQPRNGRPGVDRRTVFLVHGRWKEAVAAMQDFLRALDLDVRGWPEARLTGQEGRHNTDILDRAFHDCHAVVVFLTPDDVADLHPDLSDPPGQGVRLVGQPRPNVLFEAGYAWNAMRHRTLLVEFGGELRRISDLSGVDRVRFDGSAQSRTEVADRLEDIGVDVKRKGGAHLNAGRFPSPLPEVVVGEPGHGAAGDLLQGVPLQWILLAALSGGDGVNIETTAANAGVRLDQVRRTLTWLMERGLAEPMDRHSRSQAAANGACLISTEGMARLREERRAVPDP